MTLTLRAVSYYLSNGVPTLTATIAKEEDGKVWSCQCGIYNEKALDLWNSWPTGPNDQDVLQKIIDLGGLTPDKLVPPVK